MKKLKKGTRNANVQNFLLNVVQKSALSSVSYLARNVIGRCHRRLTQRYTHTHARMQIPRGRNQLPCQRLACKVLETRITLLVDETGGSSPPSYPPHVRLRANGVGVEGCRVSKENRD